MGRPINKRFMGKPTAGGDEIKVQFYNGTASVDGYLVKQLGSKRFRCSDGTDEADCILVDKLAPALTAGEMTVSVKDDSGAVKQVIKIAGRKVTLSSGESIKWNFTDSTTDGAVEVEEAGGVDAPTTAGNFVVGVDYTITVPGTTDFTLIGSADSVIGTVFTATGAGTGDGTATAVSTPEDTFGS